MAKGQHLTHHQRKIVHRYYEHRDTIMLQKLSEIVSDLYLCTDAKKQASLWKSAATALKQIKADPAWSVRVVETRDVQELAKLLSASQ